ncbi:ABC transporter ATP-binding protein [Streptomyces sp. CL12]|uniref:ABC transporter ATP-binding protein n=1 Tax=Streptomyces sp. CL12 TaxID=3391744 RepID=UPI003A812AC0
MALGMVARHCPGAGAALAAAAFLNAVVPVGLLAAMGTLVGDVQHAASARHDYGPSVTKMFVTVGVLLALGLTLPTVVDWIGALVRLQLTRAVRERLIQAVSAPVGVAHLEDPAVLNRIAMAEGALTDFKPGEAPLALARVYAARSGGLLACVALSIVCWWAGIGLLCLWLAVRVPLRRAVTAHVEALGGEAGVMRRARYFQQLTTDGGAGKEIRLFGLGDWVTDQFRDHWLRGMTRMWQVRGALSRTVGWIVAVVLLSYMGVCGWFGYEALHGTINLVTVVTLIPMTLMTSAVGGISFDDLAVEWMVAGLPLLRALEGDLARRTRELPGRGDAADLPRKAISFQNVGFRYPEASTSVLKTLDLHIEANESTAIVGANGAGKTTLVKLLARLHDPTEGSLLVDDRPLIGLSAANWQRNLAVIPQDFARFPTSLADNIGLGAPEALDDRAGIRAALEAAGGMALLDDLPDGWETRLGVGGTEGRELSGGQWQRVALARALFAARKGARLLVLDEPTAWLDVRGEAEFYRRFLELTEGLTTVVISHRFSTVRQAKHICVLAEGRVAEYGSHDELMALDGEYARMFRLQAERLRNPEQPAIDPGMLTS